MDEILIEEKKYVSSKRAAKITGYAKDYIGQLCREGRVPARLVGRSWYVLESAIHDHRFGNPEPISTSLKVNQSSSTEPSKQKSTSNWESPRYEASKVDILPSINRLRSPDSFASAQLPIDDQEEAPQHLQDSWKTWFDRATDTEPVAATYVPEKQEEMLEVEEEINVPIHTIYELPPENLLPRPSQTEPQQRTEQEIQKRPQKGKKGVMMVILIAGAVTALVLAVSAVIGSGYFDEYIISNSQAELITGVSIYNR